MTWHRLLKSKFFLFCLLVLLGILSYFFYKELRQRYEIESGIRGLKDQIFALEANNQKLNDTSAYLHSPSFQEKELRAKLNLQKPGEHAVALPQTPAAENQLQASVQEEKPQEWKEWWDYFFSH